MAMDTVMSNNEARELNAWLKEKLNAWFIFCISSMEDSGTNVRFFYIFKENELFRTSCKDSHQEYMAQDIRTFLLNNVKKSDKAFTLDYEKYVIMKILKGLKQDKREEYIRLLEFFSLTDEVVDAYKL